jgi:membrane-associated phospholipid phosphatase
LEPTGKREYIERVLLTLGVALLFFLGYFAVGFSTAHRRTHDFRTPVDTRIPFIARTIWIYLWSFSASVIPLCFIRCRNLFRRSALAFGVAIGVSLICFAALPVTALHLRADPAQLNAPGPSDWAVAAIYSIDPPFNLFPSLHISLTALAAFAVWKADRRYGALLFFGLALVAISVCTTKQHFVVDVLGGLAIAAAVGAAILAPYRRRDGLAVYSWRGPVSYLASLAIMYLGFYAAYLWPH